jgi:acyl-CoA thioester hydrolase
MALQFGPILFREECVFRKEIRSEDIVHIDLKLLKAKKDISRWSIEHDITKNQSILSAVIKVDGAWINMVERKLAAPHEKVIEVFNAMPKADDFEWI